MVEMRQAIVVNGDVRNKELLAATSPMQGCRIDPVLVSDFGQQIHVGSSKLNFWNIRRINVAIADPAFLLRSDHVGSRFTLIPVSYTHLDVYKRQDVLQVSIRRDRLERQNITLRRRDDAGLSLIHI